MSVPPVDFDLPHIAPVCGEAQLAGIPLKIAQQWRTLFWKGVQDSPLREYSRFPVAIRWRRRW
jgi:hypothetical protein